MVRFLVVLVVVMLGVVGCSEPISAVVRTSVLPRIPLPDSVVIPNDCGRLEFVVLSGIRVGTNSLDTVSARCLGSIFTSSDGKRTRASVGNVVVNGIESTLDDNSLNYYISPQPSLTKSFTLNQLPFGRVSEWKIEGNAQLNIPATSDSLYFPKVFDVHAASREIDTKSSFTFSWVKDELADKGVLVQIDYINGVDDIKNEQWYSFIPDSGEFVLTPELARKYPAQYLQIRFCRGNYKIVHVNNQRSYCFQNWMECEGLFTVK